MKKIISVAIIFLLTGAITDFLIAGVVLHIENNTGAHLSNVKIEYSGNTLEYPEISNSDRYWQYLGKVGEGIELKITWNSLNGPEKQARIVSYLYSNDTLVDVYITVKDHQIVFREDNEQESTYEILYLDDSTHVMTANEAGIKNPVEK